MKLYRSTKSPIRWIAHSPETAWVMFPAVIGGRELRYPARGIDPIDIREVPVSLAFETGIPAAPHGWHEPGCAFSEAT